jgi:hypothetical protein
LHPRTTISNFSCIVVLTITIACKQTYLPPIIKNPPTLLVVDGFINNGPDSTWFNLTHTYQLSSDSTAGTPELGAAVSIQGNDNTSYTLSQTGNTGLYTAHLPPLDPNTRYRLYITTTGGTAYTSDFVPVVANPPIDSVNLVRTNDGAHIYVNTHDPSGNARFYRWEYQETWVFNSAYEAGYKWVDDSMQIYSPDTTYTCWKTDNNTNIILGTSTALASDVIYETPLVFIPLNAQQLNILYSIYVRQYAITQDAFDWWSLMQNNTGNIGSIFGVQPTPNQGNLHCLTDTTQQVVGYVNAGTLRTQRTFISNKEVWPWYYQSPCGITHLPVDSIDLYYTFGFLVVGYGPGSLINVSYKTCVDCTLTGSNKKPSFWP